uniref:Alpha-1,3-mannosyl-glycoprotein 4-beta-N-acetylglucosaminyltransferase B n=1 Tax=Lygus hesperus TaxID=30085 RepID=A0A0A9Y6V1_LYGHE
MGPIVTLLKQRFVFFGLIFVFLPCSMYILISSTDITGEKAAMKRLVKLQLRVEEFSKKYRAKEEEVEILSHHLSLLYDSGKLSAKTRTLLRKRTHRMRVPSTYHFQPHLLRASSLRPAFAISKDRYGVSMALGIPSVKRHVRNYLLTTLRNILNGMSESEKNDTVIIVFVAETRKKVLYSIINKIVEHFEKELNCGLVELVSPPASYYPEMSRLRLTLGDTEERVRWRTKQNLDFAFLMMYAQEKAKFYVHLEDDVIAVPHFVTTMKNVALERIKRKKPWFVLDFCQLGMIGKMFRAADLSWIVQFFFMFHNDQPADWLLQHLINIKSCSYDYTPEQCSKAEQKQWIRYTPSFFQHIGKNSSLKGKIQNLEVNDFGSSGWNANHSKLITV